jgi:phosphoribosyl-ATP pyrophosphohydrolase
MKNFEDWNHLKKNIENKSRPPFFGERDIWYTYCGENIGHEECGKGENFTRPFLVIRRFNRYMCWAVPFTRTIKVGDPYFSYEVKKGTLSCLLLSQLRLIDSRRFIRKRRLPMDKAGFETVINKIILSLKKVQPSLTSKKGESPKANCDKILEKNSVNVKSDSLFLDQLFALIQDRKKNKPAGSYVASLFDEGLDRMAQKVGEEGVEVVIAAKNNDDDDFIGEGADLVFHLQVLCAAKNIAWSKIIDRLKGRHEKS